ncbi:hypothetical protein ONZ43_g4077 [Nemania bipapillata]|uniref:Uncharacterized protein n=1 Tax=Nemania bipapillata TaxID=110536 RepID=A0ACC2ISG0_9PEZI|nr:hypothetical protein ONZ43_g4077 [Nemania bipapillata]
MGRSGYQGGDGSYTYGTLPSPSSSSYANARTEQSPLTTHANQTSESRSPSRKLKSYLPIIVVAALHLIAAFYLLRFLGFGNSTQTPPSPLPTYNVAIIGAGPAGIAAAYHLRTSPAARDAQFNITIFESKPVLGGVLAFHHANGSSIFPRDHPTQSPITAEDIAGKALLWNNALFTRDSEKILKDSVNFVEVGSEQVG